ncbi:prolyl aminopeptidase [Kordiimonas sp. SCSIO 12603]|uniref:prolyl aminopeptidase n=1 Tax=Kordiimonas sp. SCSIO 12603 TaxID=2829596 RepID=UPI0021043BFF|nr:prolyl aminopeptidase [Kordiimonas sp. SCSIO 12603]UTW58512.1 prolyl aminopeptidase [Kordiimonas sp. SCSIO 12603]
MRADSTTTFRTLYPTIEPYSVQHLAVDGGHQIYVEQSGNPNGIPILFVHGGPGGGTSGIQRRFFNPKKFRIILFDQRGCGKSRPHASLENNTSWDLVADMEAIRKHLGVNRWSLFGGSWGSTLALLYAQAHPAQVDNLILRGIFLMRQRELDWFYQNGTRSIFPEAWDRFERVIPEEERGDMITAYYKRLTEVEYTEDQLIFAKEWSLWEGSTVTLMPDHEQRSHSIDPVFALAFARIEAHYFKHKGWLERDDQLLTDAKKLINIPTTIVQGRYDAICPPISAWDLSKAMPWAKLKMVPVAGHSAFEPAIQHELICATDAI